MPLASSAGSAPSSSLKDLNDLIIPKKVPETPNSRGIIIPKIETMRQVIQGFLQHFDFESSGEGDGVSVMLK
jgi:hypothetical protein